jgi:hypothetical protein
MKLFHTGIILCVLVLAVSCSPFRIDHDHDYMVDFSTLRTYGWLPVDIQANEIVVNQVKNAVNRELDSKGFTLNLTNPDFLVALHGQRVKKRDVVVFDNVYGAASRHDVFTYEEGTITLTMKDAQSKGVIWRGTAKGEIGSDPTTEKWRQRINEAVSEILKSFPPVP